MVSLPQSLLTRSRQALHRASLRYSQLPQGQAGREGNQGKTGLSQLQALETKLASRRLTVAVFGLVSRGKSAVINALVGEPVLETGPLHGVTRWPRSVYWQPPIEMPQADGQPWQIELVDTPGLDEVAGAVRAEMAQTVAHQADLILFVVAGDITRTEYDALQQLQQAQKPLLLVFNKTDLYPDIDRHQILTNLQRLWQSLKTPSPELEPLAVDDVLLVAACPAPQQVRVEWPDGRITQEWETPPSAIAPLRDALIAILHQDAPTLIVLNALRAARELEQTMVRQVTSRHQDQADELILQFAKYKALAVALNPIAGLDLAAGVVADLVLIRALARLYGFPITNFEAGKLWRAMISSSGMLLASELGSALLGAGKTTAALFSLVDSPSGLSALAGAVTAQASAAGYGTYAVGKAAKRYLERGCTWGPEGISATLQTVLQDMRGSDRLTRLQQTLQATLAAEAGAPPTKPNS